MIQHSLQAWATALGMERRTLEARMVKVDDPPAKRGKISAKRIYTALMGDERAEKVRNLKLDADKKERKEAEAMGNLVEWGRVEQRLNQRFFLPLQSAIDAAPEGVSQEWVEKVLKPILRGKIESPKPEETAK